MKKLPFFNVVLVILIDLVIYSCSKTNQTQTWILTNDGGQKATVVVPEFTNSGSFEETSSSEGWYVNFGGSCTRVRVPVSGTIVHDANYDRWTFTFSIGGCGSIEQCTCEGTANGKFPNATMISNGTIKGTVKGPLGQGNVDGNWTATKK